MVVGCCGIDSTGVECPKYLAWPPLLQKIKLFNCFDLIGTNTSASRIVQFWVTSSSAQVTSYIIYLQKTKIEGQPYFFGSECIFVTSVGDNAIVANNWKVLTFRRI